MIGWAGLTGAFLAGLLSFVSPCVLPLTPIYIAQLVGPQARPVGDHPAAAHRAAGEEHHRAGAMVGALFWRP